MPKYQYLGSGPIQSKTSKDGTRQYLQRCIYLAPVKDDGSGTGSATNVYLIGDRVNIIDDAKLVPSDFCFADFSHKGYLVDLRAIPDPKS